MQPKIVLSKSGVLVDATKDVLDYSSGAAALDCDTIFVGNPFRFNAIFFRIGTANTQNATMSVALWNGAAWESVASVEDGTLQDGRTLARSGTVSILPRRGQFWAIDDTQNVDGSEKIAGLGGVCVYDHAWTKISFSGAISSNSTLLWAGWMFVESDDELLSEHPVFGSQTLRTAFRAGKTSWEEQRALASRLVVEELMRRNIVENGESILDAAQLRSATVSKCAQVIYSALGDDYRDQAESARAEFERRISNLRLVVDRNDNATIDRFERGVRQGRLER